MVAPGWFCFCLEASRVGDVEKAHGPHEWERCAYRLTLSFYRELYASVCHNGGQAFLLADSTRATCAVARSAIWVRVSLVGDLISTSNGFALTT